MKHYILTLFFLGLSGVTLMIRAASTIRGAEEGVSYLTVLICSFLAITSVAYLWEDWVHRVENIMDAPFVSAECKPAQSLPSALTNQATKTQEKPSCESLFGVVNRYKAGGFGVIK